MEALLVFQTQQIFKCGPNRSGATGAGSGAECGRADHRASLSLCVGGSVAKPPFCWDLFDFVAAIFQIHYGDDF